MTTPWATGSVSARMYDALAPFQDQDVTTGYNLFAFIDALGQMLQPLADLAELGPNGEDGWSKILDVDRIDDEGLPWLAQLIGTQFDQVMTPAEQRARIKDAPNWTRGNPSHLIEVAKQYLTGTQMVLLRERDTSPYHATMNVRTNEAADFNALVNAVMAFKPIGIVLRIQQIAGQDFQNVKNTWATFTLVKNNYSNFNNMLLDIRVGGGGTPTATPLSPVTFT